MNRSVPTVSRLSTNIVFNLFGQLSLMALSFVSAGHVVGSLGADALGIIYFAMMMNTIIVAVLEMGISTATIKEVAANAERDKPYVIRIIRSGTLIFWTGYVVAALGLLLLTPWSVQHWIKLETLSPEAATSALRILGVATLLSLPQTFYTSVFRGVQRMGITNGIDVATMGLQQAGIVAILMHTHDFELVVWWIAGVYVLRICVFVAVTVRVFGWSSITPKVDMSFLRKNRGFLGHMIAISILAMVHTQADKLVISGVLPVASVGLYGLLYGTVARSGAVTSAVTQGGFPALSELAENGTRVQLVQLYQRLQDLVCYGIAPLLALIAFAALPLFTTIVGPALAGPLVLPAVLLALGFYLNATLHIPYYLTLALRKPEIATRQNVAALFVTLPVTVVLTWWLGLIGAAIGWIWYQLFSYLYSMPRICRECLQVPASAWFRHILRVFATIAVSYGAAALLVVTVLEPTSVTLLVAYGVASFAFAALAWTGIGADSRTAAADLARSVLRLRRS